MRRRRSHSAEFDAMRGEVEDLLTTGKYTGVNREFFNEGIKEVLKILENYDHICESAWKRGFRTGSSEDVAAR